MNSIAILKWLQIESTDIFERQLTDEVTEVNLPRADQTYRYLFRCVIFASVFGRVKTFTAICFFVLYWLRSSVETNVLMRTFQ